jgi:hypothetical protein
VLCIYSPGLLISRLQSRDKEPKREKPRGSSIAEGCTVPLIVLWQGYDGYLIRPTPPTMLRLLQIGGVKPLGEPAIDRCQQLIGFGGFALELSQESEAHGHITVTLLTAT